MFPTFLPDWTATKPAAASYIDRVGMAAHPRAAAVCQGDSLSRLVDLLDEDAEDDYGRLGPTQYAFKTASRMVKRAELLCGGMLCSSPAVDSEGGIRVSWRQGDRQVKLICPANADGQMYIYHHDASTNDSTVRNQNVTAEALAETLSWMSSREQQFARRTAC
jgi:hypothetical protein